VSTTARTYVLTITVIGLAGLLLNLVGWRPAESLQFFAYLAFAVLSSAWKIRVPGLMGTLSFAFVFALIATLDLGLPEAMVVACLGTLVQVVYNARTKVNLMRAGFSVSVIALSVVGMHGVFRWPVLRTTGLEWPIILFAATLTYFLVNSALVALAIALTEHRSVAAVWYECHFWSFPYYILGAAAASSFHLISSRFGWQIALCAMLVIYVAHHSYRLYLDRLASEKSRADDQRLYAEREKRHAEEIENLHLRAIHALALAIEAKDQSTHRHLARVQVYAVELGREIGLSEQELKALNAAAILHEIGKLAVPEHIISKPGKLTPEEFEKIKIHPVVGADILREAQFPPSIVSIVRSHHEKWDGTGYPDGICGLEIPIGARILALVDCFDALISDRQYRRAFSIDEALKIIVEQAGQGFDPRLVQLLQTRHEEWERKARSQTTESTLRTDIRVDRGTAPATGLAGEPFQPEQPAPSYLATIAAARHEAQQISEMSQDLGKSLSLNDTCMVLAARLRTLVPYDALAMFIKEGDVLKPEYTIGQDAAALQGLRTAVGSGLTGWVSANRQCIVNGDPALDSTNPQVTIHLRAALALPLIGSNGVIGVLSLYRTQKDAFRIDDARVMQAIQFKIALAVENGLKYREAENSSLTDFLTGLPNARSLFLRLSEEIGTARRAGDEVTVLVCDLDGFKQLNDTHGHVLGNDVLREVAQALRESCHRDDYVARMGGDEFAIVTRRSLELPAFTAALDTAVTTAARRVCGADHLTISIGHATMLEDGLTPEGLLVAADREMYDCKRSKKQRARLQVVVSA
jgi:diguanylate cyclase (GGDEF)-like protein/putative nucleotidyltransferase with HDIG domain